MTNTWFSEFWYLGWYLIPEFRYLVPVKLNSDTWHIIPDTWCDHSDTWKPICQVSGIIQVSYQNTCSEPGMLIHRNSIFHFRMHLWVGVPKGPRFDPVFDPVFDTLTPFTPSQTFWAHFNPNIQKNSVLTLFTPFWSFFGWWWVVGGGAGGLMVGLMATGCGRKIGGSLDTWWVSWWPKFTLSATFRP